MPNQKVKHPPWKGFKRNNPVGGGGKVLISRNIIGRNGAVEITPKKA
jgi:hypothetical protein